MYPELFRIGDFAISSFGVMMALAFIVGGFTARWQLRKRGARPDFAWVLVISAIIGGIVGAKIHYLIIHPDEWPSNLWSGRGLVWFGGMFGALLVAAIVTWLYKVKLTVFGDVAAYSMATGYAVGRMGCFLVGDDYGKATDLPWGIAFPKGSPPVNYPVHPAQLYEILASLAIFAVMLWLIQPHVKRDGVMFFIYLILAGVERFLVEFVRTNQAVALGLTQQQWISIALLVLGIAGTWWFSVHGTLRPLIAGAAKSGPQKGRAGAAKTTATKTKADPRPNKSVDEAKAGRADKPAGKEK